METQWDGENAFNIIKRSLNLKALKLDHKDTITYFKTAYGQPSDVVYNGHEPIDGGNNLLEWSNMLNCSEDAGPGNSVGPFFYNAGHGLVITHTAAAAGVGIH